MKRLRQEDERPGNKANRFAAHRPPPPPPVGPPPKETATPVNAVKTSVDDGRPRRLFVGNLELTINEGDILKIFAKFGTVTESDFLHHFAGPMRGRPKGFCFIEMATHEQSACAIAALNGRRLRGRELRVNFSKDSEGHATAAPGSTAATATVAGAADPATRLPSEHEVRLLDRRAAMVKATLQRLGADPHAVRPGNSAAASAAAATVQPSRAVGDSGPASEHEKVVADILNE